ncbi:hypothetical protein D5R95_01440 [Methanosalsum natronophilum]|uniref:Uncharacterized protein n=1 Tax=Methanosalsum natronophilum TaxID=768733 RepID=A0A3R7XJ33_9EURY|nr:MAG: hypothetical protein D5R95_01440 [Methanosalsum natronophilum]
MSIFSNEILLIKSVSDFIGSDNNKNDTIRIELLNSNSFDFISLNSKRIFEPGLRLVDLSGGIIR